MSVYRHSYCDKARDRTKGKPRSGITSEKACASAKQLKINY